MNHTEFIIIPDKVPARSSSKRFAERERLRAIVAKTDDLLDPPNTAQAFAQIEAAMDEAKLHDQGNNDGTLDSRMLDPPTTAERFAIIEAAIDEVLARSHPTSRPTRSRRRHKSDPRMATKGTNSNIKQELQLLKKRPSQTADCATLARPSTSAPFSNEEKSTAQESQANSQRESLTASERCLRPNQRSGLTAEGVHVLARTVPLPRASNAVAFCNGQEEPEKEMDIFRSEEAMNEFANQAYDSARSKYM